MKETVNIDPAHYLISFLGKRQFESILVSNKQNTQIIELINSSNIAQSFASLNRKSINTLIPLNSKKKRCFIF